MTSLAWEDVMPNLRDQHFGLNLNHFVVSVMEPTHLSVTKNDVSTTLQMSGKLKTAGDHLPLCLGATAGA